MRVRRCSLKFQRQELLLSSSGQTGLRLLSTSLCPVTLISQKADRLLWGRPWFSPATTPWNKGVFLGAAHWVSCAFGLHNKTTSSCWTRDMCLSQRLCYGCVSPSSMRTRTGDAVWRTSASTAPHSSQGSKPATDAWCLRTLCSPARIHRRTTQTRSSQPR